MLSIVAEVVVAEVIVAEVIVAEEDTKVAFPGEAPGL